MAMTIQDLNEIRESMKKALRKHWPTNVAPLDCKARRLCTAAERQPVADYTHVVQMAGRPLLTSRHSLYSHGI